MKPRCTQRDSNKRLAAYLTGAICAYIIQRAETPPHGWQAFLLGVGILWQAALVYRAFIDTTDGEAKANDRSGDGSGGAAPPSTGVNNEQPADS